MKRQTIADIAMMCGVSKATVSRVLNGKSEGVGEETRRLVLQTIEKANYRPSSLARGIATARSRMIGLVIPDAANLFYPTIIRAACDALDERGYSLMLCNTDTDPQKEGEQLLKLVDHRVEGVILCSGVSNKEFLARYAGFDMPVVTIGRSFDIDFSRASISGNNYSGACVATRFLLEGGSSDIFYLDGDPGTAGVIQRRGGFLSVMRDAGEVGAEARICQREFSYAYGYEQVRELLREKRSISAIFAGSDLIAIGAVKALLEHGVRVPEDIEVIGFDDIPLASMLTPPLTTMHKPHEEMAKRAVEMLIEAIDGKLGEIRHIIVEPELVLRSTTRSRK